MLTIPVPTLGGARDTPGSAPLFGSKAKGKAAANAKNPFSALLASLREGKAESVEAKNTPKKGAIDTKTIARHPAAQALGTELAKDAAKEPVKERSLLKTPFAAADAQAESQGAELKKLKDKRNASKAADSGFVGASLALPQAFKDAAKASPKQADAPIEGDKPAEPSARKESKRGGDAKYSVIDLRLKLDAKEAQETQKSARNGTPERVEAPALSRVDGAAARGAETDGLGKSVEQKAGAGNFAEVLAERLRANSTDFVRAAQVVLKDGNLGLIRLRLEPEHLGGVKIELKLAEKQISGRIIVESDLAGEAFRSSLDSLKDAFASAGFETSSLEVEVRNGNGQQGGAGQDGGADEQGGPQWSARLRELDAAVPLADGSGADGALNMIV